MNHEFIIINCTDVTVFNYPIKLGNVRKHKLKNSEKDLKRLESMSTDEVLERIQQQMAEVMANAQEVTNSAVTTENEALAVAAVIDSKASGKHRLQAISIMWNDYAVYYASNTAI